MNDSDRASFPSHSPGTANENWAKNRRDHVVSPPSHTCVSATVQYTTSKGHAAGTTASHLWRTAFITSHPLNRPPSPHPYSQNRQDTEQRHQVRATTLQPVQVAVQGRDVLAESLPLADGLDHLEGLRSFFLWISTHLLPVVEHTLGERFAAGVRAQVGREAERLHNWQVRLQGHLHVKGRKESEG